MQIDFIIFYNFLNFITIYHYFILIFDFLLLFYYLKFAYKFPNWNLFLILKKIEHHQKNLIKNNDKWNFFFIKNYLLYYCINLISFIIFFIIFLINLINFILYIYYFFKYFIYVDNIVFYVYSPEFWSSEFWKLTYWQLNNNMARIIYFYKILAGYAFKGSYPGISYIKEWSFEFSMLHLWVSYVIFGSYFLNIYRKKIKIYIIIFYNFFTYKGNGNSGNIFSVLSDKEILNNFVNDKITIYNQYYKFRKYYFLFILISSIYVAFNFFLTGGPVHLTF